MSRKSQRRGAARQPSSGQRVSKDKDHAPTETRAPLSRRRAIVFTVVMLALPLLLLVSVEAALRLFWQGGALPLFTTVNADAGEFHVANPRVGERWFFGEEHPPSPIADPFAIARPSKTLRFFVLGESTRAGFLFPLPYMEVSEHPNALRIAGVRGRSNEGEWWSDALSN